MSKNPRFCFSSIRVSQSGPHSTRSLVQKAQRRRFRAPSRVSCSCALQLVQVTRSPILVSSESFIFVSQIGHLYVAMPVLYMNLVKMVKDCVIILSDGA